MQKGRITKLDRYMRATGLTEAQLAFVADCNQSTIHRIRHGKIIPGASIALKIMKATEGQVTIEDLVR